MLEMLKGVWLCAKGWQWFFVTELPRRKGVILCAFLAPCPAGVTGLAELMGLLSKSPLQGVQARRAGGWQPGESTTRNAHLPVL